MALIGRAVTSSPRPDQGRTHELPPCVAGPNAGGFCIERRRVMAEHLTVMANTEDEADGLIDTFVTSLADAINAFPKNDVEGAIVAWIDSQDDVELILVAADKQDPTWDAFNGPDGRAKRQATLDALDDAGVDAALDLGPL